MSTTSGIPARPYVLCIAGLDPTGGAGLLADVKTLESLSCYGLAVSTANTIQNDKDFKACYWTVELVIFEQLHLLLTSFQIQFVKIGIVENLPLLDRIIDFILEIDHTIKIVWDPVLSASSGYQFQDLQGFQKNIDIVLSKVFIVTPNYEEIKGFYPERTLDHSIKRVISKTNLYLKGGHRVENIGVDQLYTRTGTVLTLEPGRIDCTQKHGSGCIHSSALTAFLALGQSLENASRNTKLYIEKILASNDTLLAYHL